MKIFSSIKLIGLFLILSSLIQAVEIDRSQVFSRLYGAKDNSISSSARILAAPDFSYPTRDIETQFDKLFPEAEPTRTRLITDNMDAWYARWDAIQSATESIDMTYFIFDEDIFGLSLLGSMLTKAKDGVKIRLMVDSRGSAKLTSKKGRKYLKALAETGNLEIRIFNNIWESILKMPITLNFLKDVKNVIASNHDKIIIVDQKTVIVGGRNISKDYMTDVNDHAGAYRDTDVLLQGSRVASQIKKAFDEEYDRHKNYEIPAVEYIKAKSKLFVAFRVMKHWITGHGTFPKLSKESPLNKYVQQFNEDVQQYPRLNSYAAFKAYQGQRQYPVQILDKHSMTDGGVRNDITPNLIKLMDACSEEIIIQNPYVVLTKKAKAAIIRAGERGVRIVILTNSPASSDSLATQAIFIKEWRKIARLPNVELWAIQTKHKLHAKVFIFDHSISVVGTYNMDPMSEQINSEVVAVVKSRTMAERGRLRIETDLKEAIQYKLKSENQREISPDNTSDPKKVRWLHRLGSVLKLVRSLI